MDLDAVADLLYAASPDDFVGLRTEQVAAARAARDRPLAKQISQLRRPTRSAWLVNLLAHNSPAELGALLDLGAELRDAQSRLDAAELRRLSGERRRVVDTLAERAGELGVERGYQSTDAVRQEVVQTLQAALADPDLSDQVRTGRVTQAIAYGGFGPFGLGEPAEAKSTKPTTAEETATRKVAEKAGTKVPARADPAIDIAPDPALEKAAEAARTAADQWRQAQQETATAAAEAERATREADELADRVESLRGELAEAERAERGARDLAWVARKRLAELAGVESRAEEAASRARAKLTHLGGEA